MMNCNSQIYITNNFEDVRNAVVAGVTVVALVDDGEKYRYMNCTIMGNLLPPYESLSAEIDGDINTASGIYYSYLMSKLNVIANILGAMNMGKQILLFVPEDESMNFGFVSVLRVFFDNVFGIHIGLGSDQCCINNQPQFLAARADVLFVNNLVPFENYCLMMPPGIPPSEFACGKIMQAINYRFNTMPECISYCYQYIQSMQQQHNGMIAPMFRVTPS